MNDKLISCQAAINIAMQYCPDDDGTCSKGDRDIRELLDDLENLPSAQPERKTGKWIREPNVCGVVYCSECDHELHTNNTNFCPNCGAEMTQAGTESDGTVD